MRRLTRDALQALRGVIRNEPALTAAGSLGIVLAGGLAVAILLRGASVPPEGNLEKPLTFDLAIGIYVLTLAALAGVVRFPPRLGRMWRVAIVVTTLYAYGAETIQAARGFDPRFTRAGGAVEQILGSLLGLDAVFMIILFTILAVRFFRPDVTAARPLLVLGARYGAAAVVLGGFAAGFWMGAIQGRHVGESASLLPLHALGFHGLQAIPLLGWLLERSPVSPGRARARVHAAGVLWLLAVAGIGVQTVLGVTVARLAPAVLAALAAGVGWAAVTMAAVASALRASPGR